MATYDLVRNLPLEIESYELEGLKVEASPEFVAPHDGDPLHGGGHEGVGEDVTYSSEDQEALQAEGPTLPLAGKPHARQLLAAPRPHGAVPERPGDGRLPRLPPLGVRERGARPRAAPGGHVARRGGRARAAAGQLRRFPADRAAAGARPDPALLERYPKLRFKLDPTSEWDAKLVKALAETGAVDTVDLKGAYKGTPVDQAGDPLLYGLVAQAFPNAWIEDPDLNAETDVILEPHRDRVTWDAPIHSVLGHQGPPLRAADAQLQAVALRSIQRLFEGYDYCAEQRDRHLRRRPVGARPRPRAHPVPRVALPPVDAERRRAGSVQHPPNDPPPGLPTSPLQPQPNKTGFRWGEAP